MRGTRERFQKYEHLLPASQGITSPAVEVVKAAQMVGDAVCPVPACGRRVADHTPREIHDCALEARGLR
jgi:hypothetical protein